MSSDRPKEQPHYEKLENQVTHPSQIKRGGIYRKYHGVYDPEHERHNPSLEGEPFTEWFLVVSGIEEDEIGKWVEVLYLDSGKRDRISLGDAAVVPYGDWWNGANAMEKHPEIEIPPEALSDPSLIKRLFSKLMDPGLVNGLNSGENQ